MAGPWSSWARAREGVARAGGPLFRLRAGEGTPRPGQRVRLLLVAALLAGGAGAPLASSGEPESSVKGASSRERLARLPATAGPDVLRAEPVLAPQLEGSGPFKAAPLLVSGATAYRDGEFLYQDWLYDDTGAAAPSATASSVRSGTSGTYTYPSDEAQFAHNAADLVEFRVVAQPRRTVFRVTLNTLAADPGRTAFTVALGRSAAPVAYPFGAGVRGPASRFLTVHGTSGVLTDAKGRTLGRVAATVDRRRYQYTVALPTSLWSPGRSVVPMTVGVGLWDPAAGRYLAPRKEADERTPGGAGSLEAPPAFFNVGPRREPALAGTWWDREQSSRLAAGDVTTFSAEVDFGKLRRGADDESGVPRTGVLSRVLSSRMTMCPIEPVADPPTRPFYEHGTNSTGILSPVGHAPCPKGTRGRGFSPTDRSLSYRGELQPYAVHVPAQRRRSYGLAIALHGGGGNYNEHNGTPFADALMATGGGTVLLMPQNRGSSNQSRSAGMADTFEAWADAARWYPLDPRRTVLTGISQGGHGLYRLASAWPDLVGRIYPVVGAEDDDRIRSLRNVEVRAVNGVADYFVPFHSVQGTVQRLADAGYRFRVDQYAAEHAVAARFGGWQDDVTWLGGSRAPRDPRQVTYVHDPAEALPAAGLDVGHAYWVTSSTTRGAGRGVLDAVRHSTGAGAPPVDGPRRSAGVTRATTGQVPALPYVRQEQSWGAAPAAPRRDALELRVTNIRALTVDVRRAGLTCRAQVDVTTDGPVTVTLAGCGRTVRAG